MSNLNGMPGPTSRHYFSQRLRLHYVDWGNPDAPPLLLVHGGRDHCRNWDWVAVALRKDWHIICPDLRGHGDSKIKNQRPITASLDWRTNSHDFAQDIDPALDWLPVEALVVEFFRLVHRQLVEQFVVERRELPSLAAGRGVNQLKVADGLLIVEPGAGLVIEATTWAGGGVGVGVLPPPPVPPPALGLVDERSVTQ